MNRFQYILVAFAMMLGPSAALASKEGMLVMGRFEIASQGIGSSGPVVISGNQSDQGIEALTVTAFGKTFKLDKGQLTKLADFPANGMQLSYEAGYKELGGRTIYIVLSKGFTSGVISKKLIVITESGEIKVSNRSNASYPQTSVNGASHNYSDQSSSMSWKTLPSGSSPSHIR